jgi:hypothetical protein
MALTGFSTKNPKDTDQEKKKHKKQTNKQTNKTLKMFSFSLLFSHCSPNMQFLLTLKTDLKRLYCTNLAL